MRYRPPEEIEIVEQIRRLIARKMSVAPGWEKKDIIRITMRYEFEPHGRASETWEVVWRVYLPYIHAMWHGTKGWNNCSPGLQAYFAGRTLLECLRYALAFVENAPWEPLEPKYWEQDHETNRTG